MSSSMMRYSASPKKWNIGTPMSDSESDEEFNLLLSAGPTFSATKKATTTAAAASTAKKRDKPPPSTIKKRSPEEIAEDNVKILVPPFGITSPDQLYWQVIMKNKKMKKIFPCRICHHEEAVGLAIQSEWDPRIKDLVQFLGHFETSDRQVVRRTQLMPYHNNAKKYDEETSDTLEWCPNFLDFYSKQLRRKPKSDEAKVLTEIKFLHKILQHAKEKECQEAENERMRQEESLDMQREHDGTGDAAFQVSEKAQSSDAHDQEEEEDEDLGCLRNTRKTEPLCAGDVIEYTNPVFKDGDKRGHRTATILSVVPRRDFVLTLDNGEFLPNDHRVKRIKVKYRNTLKDNAENGRFRKIEDYKLRKSGDNTSITAGLQMEGQRLGAIIEKNTNKFREQAVAEGFAPLDLMNNFATVQTTTVAEGTTPSAEQGLSNGKSEPQMTDSQPKARSNATKHNLNKLGQQTVQLQKRITALKENSSRRRGTTVHMTLEQLELALEVRNLLLEKWTTPDEFEKGLEALSMDLGISSRGIRLFLMGDPGVEVGRAQHCETLALLREWKDEQLLGEKGEIQHNHTEECPPIAITQSDEEINMNTSEYKGEDDQSMQLLPAFLENENTRVEQDGNDEAAIVGKDSQNPETDTIGSGEKAAEDGFSDRDMKCRTGVSRNGAKAREKLDKNVADPTSKEVKRKDKRANSKKTKGTLESKSVSGAIKPSKVEASQTSQKAKQETKKVTGEKAKAVLKSNSNAPASTTHTSDITKGIEKQIANLKQIGNKRRRSSGAHMTLPQLELALEVRRVLETQYPTEDVFKAGLEEMANEFEIHYHGLLVFLEGDEKRMLGIAVHEDTATKLREWKQARLGVDQESVGREQEASMEGLVAGIAGVQDRKAPLQENLDAPESCPSKKRKKDPHCLQLSVGGASIA